MHYSFFDEQSYRKKNPEGLANIYCRLNQTIENLCICSPQLGRGLPRMLASFLVILLCAFLGLEFNEYECPKHVRNDLPLSRLTFRL